MPSNTYTIKNAKLLFRNFAGVQDRFGNSARTFCVIIPDDAVEDFQVIQGSMDDVFLNLMSERKGK